MSAVNNVPSFRQTFTLSGKDPELENAVEFCFNGLVTHEQAFAKIGTSKTAAATSSTTTETVQTSTENTVVITSTIGMVNDQTGNTVYATQQSDYGGFILLSDASAIAVTLTQGTQITVPWYTSIINLGAGAATLTPATGQINGAATFVLPGNNAITVAYDGTNFWVEPMSAEPENTPAVVHQWIDSYDSSTGVFGQSQPAYSDISGTPILPATIAAVTHFFLTSYTSGTGAFTAAQPAFSDILGNIATSQLPTVGLSVTIVTAQLTPTGTQGSMTFTNGLLTTQTPAT